MEANEEQELLEQIDLYLDGSLSNRELKDFEHKLITDPSFASEVEKIRIARSFIKNYALREKLKSIHIEEIAGRNKKTVIGDFSNYTLRVAAGLALLIVGIFVFQFITLDNSDLYDDKYQSYEVAISRGDDESISNPLVYNYINGNYEDVIHIYENKPVLSNKSYFLVGSAYLHQGQYTKAIESFKKIVQEAEKGGSTEYLDDAEYYLGLAFLKQDNVSSAYWYFSKIYHDSTHPYYDKVDQLFYWKLRLLNFKEGVF